MAKKNAGTNPGVERAVKCTPEETPHEATHETDERDAGADRVSCLWQGHWQACQTSPGITAHHELITKVFRLATIVTSPCIRLVMDIP